ncbi:hypothetical protein [Bacillus alkalicellulosilyticus]|uniref:hypothetical protein n=1 Tax=Alkalihalobacterium alkalicellulosilyticum TaxID=1912214 RepID=UPI0009968D54|nr:hypothetical protein [Bacillus alkalicellulosilyticus]
MFNSLIISILLVATLQHPNEYFKYRVHIFDSQLEQEGTFILLEDELNAGKAELQLPYIEHNHAYVHSVDGITWLEPIYSPWQTIDKDFMRLLDTRRLFEITYSKPDEYFPGEQVDQKIHLWADGFGGGMTEVNSFEELFTMFGVEKQVDNRFVFFVVLGSLILLVTTLSLVKRRKKALKI